MATERGLSLGQSINSQRYDSSCCQVFVVQMRCILRLYPLFASLRCEQYQRLQGCSLKDKEPAQRRIEQKLFVTLAFTASCFQKLEPSLLNHEFLNLEAGLVLELLSCVKLDAVKRLPQQSQVRSIRRVLFRL